MTEFMSGVDPTRRFVDAVVSVRRYNMGVLIPLSGNLFTGLIDEAEQPHPPVSSAEKLAMQRGLTTGVHTDELREMGIALFDPHASAETQGEAPKRPTMLIMRIADPEAFSLTLQELAPNNDLVPAVMKGVNTVLGASVGMVRLAYDPQTDPALRDGCQSIADEQLDMFARLRPVLAAQGYDQVPNYQNLTMYLIHQQAGTLTDYVDAVERGFMLRPDQFGPGGWETDSLGADLLARWQEAFDHLKALRDKKPASPFYSELFLKLRRDFDTSAAAIDNVPASEESHADLRAAMLQLGEVWSAEFPLENSYYLALPQEGATG